MHSIVMHDISCFLFLKNIMRLYFCISNGDRYGFYGYTNSHTSYSIFILPLFRFLSTRWPILQNIAHHIQDKLAISFDSSSIGLISYKWFLTIYDKYSSVKTYNEEVSIFLEKKYLFKIFQIHHLHVYFDIIPSPDIRGALKKYCKFIFISHQVHKPGKRATMFR